MRAFFSPSVMKVRRQENIFVRVLKNKKKLTEVLCAVNPIHFKMKRNKRYSHFQKIYIATKPHYIKDKRDFNAKTMVPGRCRRSE